MTAELRIGLVGCGRIAELGHVPAIAACPGARLVAVADPDPGRRGGLAAAAGARAHATAQELVDAGGIDAVVVATPPAEHVAAARLAAAAGLPALVEKPPADDLEGARELAALDPAPWIGFNRRFAQGSELAGRIPAGGPLELELELRYRRRSWGAHQVSDDALLDLGPHLADLALLLGGGPLTVRTARGSRERGRVELDTARGPAILRCATDRSHFERVSVRVGGRLVARSTQGGLVRGVMARARRGPHPLVLSLTRQLDAFVVAAAGGSASGLASAADGVAVMAVIDTARALALREPVSAPTETQPQATA